MNTLTARQEQLLNLVADCWREGFAPVVAELAQRLGLAGQSSITPTLETLERKGFIEIHGGVRGRQRQILLTTRGKIQTRAAGLPVVGCIMAGPLSEALQMANVFVDSVDLLLPFQNDDFLLQVDGDSMIGDGILGGDRVLVRPNVAPQNGEIVAVHVGDDYCATLKRIFFHPKTKPSNCAPRMKSTLPSSCVATKCAWSASFAALFAPWKVGQPAKVRVLDKKFRQSDAALCYLRVGSISLKPMTSKRDQ
jgi:repressor LexA